MKERYCRTPVNHIRCIWRDQNKQRQPCTTNVNDSLDDCYNDAPEDILLLIIQIHTDTTELLTITLYYTTSTIMLQGRTCRRWVNHEFECHKVVVNATDKLRPCSSNTMNDSNCLVSVSVSVGSGGATATITAGTPTTSDNTDSTASFGSYDTVAAVAVSTASDDSDNTAAVSSDVAPSADATSAGTTIVSTTTTTPRPSAVMWLHRLMPPLLEQPSPTTATTLRPSTVMRPHRLMPPLLSPTTATTSHPSAVRWPHRLMPPLLEQPSSPTTATAPCHLVVMMLALLGLEGSQTRKLPSLPARLIHTDDSDNAIPASGNTATAPAALVTTSTPHPH